MERAFYAECEEILGVDHAFKERFERLNRWNHRMPGNGRFPGYGLVRLYSSGTVHISFARHNRVYQSREAALEALRGLRALQPAE